jgi:FixJ family two-component response regulator
MSKGRLLIADDEETFLISTAELFRHQGYEVDAVADADQALDKAEDGRYDVLIADIRMPGNTDLRLLEELNKRGVDLPVILITGYPSVKTAVRSVNLAVIAYLTKPVEFDELREAVERAVRTQEARRAIVNNAQRLSDWSSDLFTMREGGDARSGVDVEAFFALTTRNILQSLSDLRNLTRALEPGAPTSDACHLLGCPRPLELTKALSDAIAILQKTKSSFKSKELGALRKRLEHAIKVYGIQLGDYEGEREVPVRRADSGG